MKKILVASHGKLASGAKSVAGILLHDDSAVTAVDCYLDDSDPSVAIKEWIESVSPDDDALIFTDLLGGSVCNTITQMKPEERGIIHITGFNIAAFLELLIAQEPYTEEMVDTTLATAQTLMQRVKLEEDGTVDAEEEDDDFFA